MKTLQSKYLIYYYGIVMSLLLVTPKLKAQGTIHISGRVFNKRTGKPLPFATVVQVGKNRGTITDENGYYKIDVEEGNSKIEAQLLGYQKQIKTVSANIKSHVINFMLVPQSLNLNQVVIAGKRLRYRNKGNPAVELIKKVIKNKNLNRLKSLDYYQYDKYNKTEFIVNNLNEKLFHDKLLKGYRFVSQYADTSEENGSLSLPVFFKETSSKIYYRKLPRSKKEYITGTKMTGFPEFIDKRGISTLIGRLFTNINIYDNNILLLTNQFVSPISVIAPDIYKFRILDTLNVDGYSCINVAFQPRNKADFAFEGNLYITNDSRNAVVKAVLRTPHGINLNFVKSLQIVQEFKFFDKKIWALSRDQTTINFFISNKTANITGKKTDYYNQYIFNKKQNDSVYSGVETKIFLPQANTRTALFWEKNRISPLHRDERNIYVMMDSLQQVPAYKRSANILMLLYEGYWNIGKIDIGPTNTFYSFNSVEGHIVRLAARTSPQFSKRFRLSGNIAYGFQDKKYKYGIKALWSLNNIPLNKRPTQTLSITYQNETKFPGMALQEVEYNDFFLSYKRGVADKILYYKLFKIQHYGEWGNGFSTRFAVSHLEEMPGGNWQFDAQGYPLNKLIVSDVSAEIRFAPNETYYKGMDYRTPIVTKYPVFQLNYTQSFKNVLSSDFTYSKLSVSVFKRMYLGIFGYLDSYVEAGKVFGSKIPYPLLYLHHANQTYSYQPYSFNMMNFLEFVSDKYAAYFGEYHFNGFIFNQIPLLKHLKLRAIVSFKALFGGLSNENNPQITPGLMPFPTDANGNPTTFTLKNKPYMEAGIGIGNIFKLFRVDLIKRLTYLNNPNVNKYGIRLGFKVDF